MVNDFDGAFGRVDGHIFVFVCRNNRFIFTTGTNINFFAKIPVKETFYVTHTVETVPSFWPGGDIAICTVFER